LCEKWFGMVGRLRYAHHCMLNIWAIAMKVGKHCVNPRNLPDLTVMITSQQCYVKSSPFVIFAKFRLCTGHKMIAFASIIAPLNSDCWSQYILTARKDACTCTPFIFVKVFHPIKER